MINKIDILMKMSNTRWCPTPEQVMVLEELYRRGLRTPRASQIQKITAHLSLYGNIQGKNVFYWFQNHKARDRQRLRKKLHHHHHLYPQFHSYYPLLNINIPFHQGNGICEDEVPDDVGVKDNWVMMRRYGHDVADSSIMMVMEEEKEGPRSKPLETLDLFPLTSPSTATAAASKLI